MKKNGFSLVEILVVIFIVGLLSSIVFINYQEVRGQLALNRAAHQLLQDLRRAQEMSMSATDLKGQQCTFSPKPLHFASIGHIAQLPIDGGIQIGDSASCRTEINGDSVNFYAETTIPPGHVSYTWAGYAVGCGDIFHCIKQITQPLPSYDAQVIVTDTSRGRQIIATCYEDSSSDPLGGSWQLTGVGAVDSIYNYGVFIDLRSPVLSALGSDTSYRLYVDVDGPNALGGEVGYNDGDCIIETMEIAEPGVFIKEIRNIETDRSYVSLGFSPPNPDINISGLLSGQDTIEIVLALEIDPDNPEKQRVISVNKAGLLEIK